MATIDFKELPEAGKASGQQDTFEMFARELLEHIGFRIIQGPSRGADGGKDLIIEETRTGLTGITRIKWIVSCKHFAFSGKSVTAKDEKNVLERVLAAECQGFLGFYSTLPSSAFSDLLHRQSKVKVKLFDREEIERLLLTSRAGQDLIKRFFPTSAAKLKHVPPVLFSDSEPLTCEECGKNLLDPPSGIWVLWRTAHKLESYGRHYVDVHFCCKGECDRRTQVNVESRHSALGRIYDSWDDIPDLIIPTVFLTRIMGFINGMAQGDKYEPDALEKKKQLFIALFPFISRHPSDEDKERLSRLTSIPSYLGGMG